ncbi:hypothetical protein RAD16_35975 [Bradyrhizobium sp. 18BD]
MRTIILALTSISVLACPGTVRALDCAIPAYVWSRPAEGEEISPGQQRRDERDRFNVYALEQAPIIFRGRVASARYLSDLRKTNVPLSLLVFDRVEILKGQLFTKPRDRRAFVIRSEWCDASCIGKLSKSVWPVGKTVAVAAYQNKFADPSKAVESSGGPVVYRGRIDAVLGACGLGPLDSRQLELLNKPDEMARIKHEAEVRRTD